MIGDLERGIRHIARPPVRSLRREPHLVRAERVRRADIQLSEWKKLARPVRNDEKQRFSSHRWSTRLAVERATSLAQLSLESPLEWSLFDALRAAAIPFRVLAGEVRDVMSLPFPGRARFVLEDGRTVTYAGANGFEIVRGTQRRRCASVRAVIEALWDPRLGGSLFGPGAG